MTSALQADNYVPERAIDEIADFIADPVNAADFPQHILRFRNDRAAATVGLDRLDDAQWITHFGRFGPLPGAQPAPLALRYHGHQFRYYNPDLGDGRGFLFAQLRERAEAGGRLLDLGTKGSGLTPYSRTADGRLTLKGGVREILATEMLEALGVTTSRSFSLIETGEQLVRGDEPSPTRSAVLVRLSHGHIRIGSFQRLAYRGETENIARLADYCLRYLLDMPPGDNAALTLLAAMVERAADLAASYMVAGFVHGVLNSDNINISGESFDYGPWRFTPYWTPGFTAAYFDQTGLYAFARQPEAIHWNLVQLARSLISIADQDALIAILQRYADIYEQRLIARFLWRLGHDAPDMAAARAFVIAAVEALREGEVPIDRFFFDWRRGQRSGSLYGSEAWDKAREAAAALTLRPGALDHAYWQGDGPCSMHIDEVEALWAAIDSGDDWAPLMAKIAAIRAMGAAHGRAAPAKGLTS
ncbi:MAG: selenoprotein O [Sphingobium sp. 66-54]|nr:MAG: selenoprotein O [Sphingobium sp. 66-54]